MAINANRLMCIFLLFNMHISNAIASFFDLMVVFAISICIGFWFFFIHYYLADCVITFIMRFICFQTKLALIFNAKRFIYY